MSKQKPGIPKGTRDFGPEKMAKRNYIFDTIKEGFRKFGFEPLETPSMENLSVLTGKYGEEGDQLIFKVLNSGDFLTKTTPGDYEQGYLKLLPKIAEKGLRYDLTVPFARYVVMNRHEITFPFKRYQIQPVWRADRPQKGRYREFYQCDADIIGTKALLCEAELLQMTADIFARLGISKYALKINNRKILTGIAEHIGAKGWEDTLCVAIDKLDKIGMDAVLEELKEKGLSEDASKQLLPILSVNGTNGEKLKHLKEILKVSSIGEEGINEIETVLELVNQAAQEEAYPANTHIEFDITLARGLAYYTGTIFETKATNVSIGSIGGGGRYDNLTGVFGLPDVSGVGFSFGVDRIFDVMETLGLFPEGELVNTRVLVANFDANSQGEAFNILTKLRNAGVGSAIYPEPAKLKKQFSYAEKKQIPYILMAGSEELETGKYGLKNIISGEQESLSLEAIIEKLLPENKPTGKKENQD